MRTEFHTDEERESPDSYDRSAHDAQVGDSTTSGPEHGFTPDAATAPTPRGSAPEVPVELARGDVQAQEPEADVDDPALVAALGAGDHRRVMTILVNTHGDHVYRYCRRMLGTAAETDDVSQTVFVQAFQCLKDLPRVQRVRGWLLRIARNRCIDRLRARRRDPATVDQRDLSTVIDMNAGDGADMDDPRVNKALDECLDRLDERSRAVLVLRFRDGLSYNEISELLSDTVGALRIRLVRALSAVRRCLERKGVRP